MTTSPNAHWYGTVVALEAAGSDAVRVTVSLDRTSMLHPLVYPVGDAVPGLHQRVRLTVTQVNEDGKDLADPPSTKGAKK